MNTNNEPRTIVAGIDYSDTSDLALARAFELASRDPDIELHLIHVIAPPLTPYTVLGPDSLRDARAVLAQHVEKRLQTFLARHPNGKVPKRVVCHVRVNEPAHEIAQLAADLEADLILVGTHGRRSVARFFLGSVAEVVVRLAPCAVLVVRPKTIGAPTPQIEPPCPQCLEMRRHTAGARYWCDQHLERHGQRHTYHQGDRVSRDSSFPLVFKP